MAKVFNVTNLKKTYYYFKRNGVMQTIGAALERVQAPYYADYQYVLPSEQILESQRQTLWKKHIRFSVVVPAYETKEEFLKVLINSLLEQTYPYWELVIADASSTQVVKNCCLKYNDDRIKYIALKKNDGISENTNQGIKEVTGDYIGLLDHDDYLTPDALYEMAAAITKGKENGQEYGLLYSDEDKCDEHGRSFYDPHIKTDFNLDLFLTNNYICHFCVMKKELMQKLKFRKEFDGAQDYDIFLRAVDELWNLNPKVEETICHIPKVLYHWRCHINSTAANPQSKRYAYDAGKRALQAFINARGWKAEVEEMAHVGFYKINYKEGVFAQRKDVAAICGKRSKAGKVISGVFDDSGNMLYKGLPSCYSGYIHRGVLAQNVSRMDIEHWEIHPDYRFLVENFLKKYGDVEQENLNDIQKEVCNYLREQGLRLYWDPSWKQ